jgi:hypothetical protein
MRRRPETGAFNRFIKTGARIQFEGGFARFARANGGSFYALNIYAGPATARTGNNRFE